jgi:hypothetical protein
LPSVQLSRLPPELARPAPRRRGAQSSCLATRRWRSDSKCLPALPAKAAGES